MKKGMFYFVAAFLFMAIVVTSQTQQPKTIKIEVNEQQLGLLLQIIDDSALPGDIRKPLLNNIRNQAVAQLYPKGDTSKIKKPITDSTAKKKK